MTCESVRDMLGAYVDGELDANAEFQLRAHLAECPECPDAYRRLRSLQQAIKPAICTYRPRRNWKRESATAWDL